MNITTKKLVIIFICLALLLPVIFVSSAEGQKSFESSKNMNLIEEYYIKKSYTIYRFGPDGTISPVQVEIDVGKGQNLGESIADKCEELFENDKEMQSIFEIELENLTFGFICKIKSQGKGFHYKSMYLEKIIARIALFRLGLPRITTILHAPLIVCRYPNDLNAKTKITQLFALNETANTTKIVEGNHTVIAQNFIGYTTWLGRFSKSFLDIVPRAFSGFARFVICNKLP